MFFETQCRKAKTTRVQHSMLYHKILLLLSNSSVNMSEVTDIDKTLDQQLYESSVCLLNIER